MKTADRQTDGRADEAMRQSEVDVCRWRAFLGRHPLPGNPGSCYLFYVPSSLLPTRLLIYLFMNPSFCSGANLDLHPAGGPHSHAYRQGHWAWLEEAT